MYKFIEIYKNFMEIKNFNKNKVLSNLKQISVISNME